MFCKPLSISIFVIVDFAILLRRLTAEASRASNMSRYDTGKEIRYIRYSKCRDQVGIDICD
jgi:hypothetical protein